MIVLYCIGGFIALVLLIAAIAGTQWCYERSITINASPENVWPHVSSLAALTTWNPWMALDPDIRQTYSGVDGSAGASYEWDSNVKNVGAGIQTILSVTEKSELLTRIDFIRPFKGTGQGYVRMVAEGKGTKVTWGISSSTPYPMNIIKVFGVIEKNLDKDFSTGLNKLKTICEK